jgi:hypothetical protein
LTFISLRARSKSRKCASGSLQRSQDSRNTSEQSTTETKELPAAQPEHVFRFHVPVATGTAERGGGTNTPPP